MIRPVASAVLFTAIASAAFADQVAPKTLLLPGSLSVTSGTLSPAEAGNTMTTVTIDQGVTLWKRGSLFAGAYAAMTVRDDSSGFAWNRGATFGSGVRVSYAAGNSLLQASVAAAYDERPGAAAAYATTASGSFWSGWAGRHDGRVLTPGSIWAISGRFTPREGDNWISAVSAEQGVQLFRYHDLGVIPLVSATLSVDSKGFDWNNRAIGDVGVKLAHPVRGGIVDVRVVGRREYRWESGITSHAPAIVVNFWMGWSPRVVTR